MGGLTRHVEALRVESNGHNTGGLGTDNEALREPGLREKACCFLSLWSTTTLSTLKSHLNTPFKETPMFAGRQLQSPLTL
jgi:hypothetical protein